MTRRIYLSAPDVGEAEERRVLGALRSGWVAPIGPDVDGFEGDVARRVGVAHAVALSSGTAALHLALLSYGIGPGDVVVVPTLTFAATANAVVYTGARPYFVDCEPLTGNLDPDLLDEAVRRLRAAGHRVRAAVPVDLLGKCADYNAGGKAAEQHDLPILSDAAESFGASRDGRPAGSFGRAAALSFNGNKIMTTSGGGMLLTGDAALADRVRYLATQARRPVAHYEHADIGYNYRLSNLLAALGRAQLARLEEMMGRRRLLRELYRALFADVPGVRIFGGDDDATDNCWLTSILVDPAVCCWTAGELATELAAANIETRPLWKPMHLQPVFAGADALITGAAQRLFETGLTLPSGSALTAADIDRVAGSIRAFLRRVRNADIWITETGGIVHHNRWKYDEERAARAVRHVFKLTSALPRVRRVYIYNWRDDGNRWWDSGLIARDGTERKAYYELLDGLSLDRFRPLPVPITDPIAEPLPPPQPPPEPPTDTPPAGG